MATIAENLNKLLNIKAAIKEALYFVGQEVADKMEDWAMAIRNICNVPFENLGYSKEEAELFNKFITEMYKNGLYAKNYIENNPDKYTINNPKLGVIHDTFVPKITNESWLDYLFSQDNFTVNKMFKVLPCLTFLGKETPTISTICTPFFILKTPNLETIKNFLGPNFCARVVYFNADNVKSSESLFESSIGYNGYIWYLYLTGIGTQSEFNNLNVRQVAYWGMYSYSFMETSKNSVIYTLLTNSFDRATAGYSVFTITLSQSTFNILTEEEITAITNKGYTITV